MGQESGCGLSSMFRVLQDYIQGVIQAVFSSEGLIGEDSIFKFLTMAGLQVSYSGSTCSTYRTRDVLDHSHDPKHEFNHAIHCLFPVHAYGT